MVRLLRSWITGLRHRALPAARPSGVTAPAAILAGRLAAVLGPTAALLLAMGLFAQDPDDFRSSPFLRIDPDRIMVTEANGFAPCGECHTAEWDVWKDTNHATGFDTMHRTESARDILSQMDLRVTKRQESLCMRCHYTVGADRQAIAGVSCESCHGPGRDWIDVHNQWGEGVTHPEQEAPENRERRIAESIEGGMLRPSGDLYAVAANCYECHTVPMEELVNRGGHSTGSAGFDLVKRVEEVRHNFVHAQWGDPGGNRELSSERTRMMFVVGRILGYEFSIRGLAAASASGRYASAMERRVKQAYRELEEVAAVAPVPEVVEVLRVGADLRLVPDNRAQLEGAAERIRAIGQRFTGSADGAALASLDPLIAGDRPAGAPAAPGTAAPGDAAPAADPAATGAAPGAPPGAPAPAATPAAAPASEAPPPTLPGRVRQRPDWFPSPSGYGIVGAGKCASCHAGAEDWWFDDPHQRSGRRLFGEDPRSRQIAELYGIGAGALARGDQICTSCHTTVDEGTRAVREEGVSCESCHGAGSGFLEPHEDGGNPQLGMTALKQASGRAQNCARCHHISDERLLAAGHPSGADYDVVQANRQIEHWPGRRPDRGRQQRGEPAYAALADGALRTAFAAAISGRPIPSVEVVSPPARTVAAGGAAVSPAARPGASAARPPAARGSRAVGSSIAPRPPSSLPPREPGSAVSLDLEPLPESTDSLTTEELLLLVKRRLESLYSALGRGN